MSRGSLPKAPRSSTEPAVALCHSGFSPREPRNGRSPSFSGEAKRRPENLRQDQALEPSCHEMLGSSPSMTAPLRAPTTYPRPCNPPLSSAHLTPRGGHPEACCMAGRGRRLRPGLHPGPGRLRGTALGILRSLCEELAGRFGESRTERGTGDEAMSRADPGSGRSLELRPYKRGPETEIAGKRSATGRADGGSIHPRRILAQRKRLGSPAPRGAPLAPRHANARAMARAAKTLVRTWPPVQAATATRVSSLRIAVLSSGSSTMSAASASLNQCRSRWCCSAQLSSCRSTWSR